MAGRRDPQPGFAEEDWDAQSMACCRQLFDRYCWYSSWDLDACDMLLPGRTREGDLINAGGEKYPFARRRVRVRCEKGAF